VISYYLASELSRNFENLVHAAANREQIELEADKKEKEQHIDNIGYQQ